MPALHKNRVKMSVTGTPGTGTITLNAASSAHQSFATAYGANATVDILITEGTSWEIARNCTYTHSGTTVDRGTLEASSTGSAVTFTSAATVEVILIAGKGNLIESALLEHVAASPTVAGVTGVVGTLHLLDISGLTASRNFTLPATAAVGDRVGVYLTTGDASFELILIGDTGDTINGGSAATEWSRLFITNECVIFRCITANSAWIVEYDGRIPQAGLLRLSTSPTNTESAATFVYATATSGAWTADVNVGSCCDVATDKITARRAGNYRMASCSYSNQVVADTKYFGSIIEKNATSTIASNAIRNPVGGVPLRAFDIIVDSVPMVTGDYIRFKYRSEEGSKGLTSSATAYETFMSMVEVL